MSLPTFPNKRGHGESVATQKHVSRVDEGLCLRGRRSMKHVLLLLMFTGGLLWVAGCGGADKNVGDACSDTSECIEGTCHSGMCVSPKPVDDGAACTNNAECKSLVCTSAKCAAGVAKTDTACLNNLECASGFCFGGKCTLKKDGAACTASTQCAGGTCYDSKCSSKKDVDAACTAASECASNVCASSKCRKACTKKDDCKTGDVCGTSDDKQFFCFKPSYDTNMGKFCGDTGSCAGGLKCLGTKGDWAAVCTNTCTTSMDCPPNMTCDKQLDGTKYCAPREFCSACADDTQCGHGQVCAAVFGGTAKYCTTTCNETSECSMFADCKTVGSSKYCVHKQGKCAGDGSLCAPCTGNSECKSGGICLSLPLSGERFCGTDCTSGQTCPTGYFCGKVTSTLKQCIPNQKGSVSYYTCTKGINFPVFQKGDTIEDFGMVGYNDTDGDGSYSDEKLGVIRLSDFKSKAKYILLNIMTFW